MNKNIRTAKQLVKIAKALMGFDPVSIDDTVDFLLKKDNVKEVGSVLDIAEAKGNKYILHHK